MRIVGVVLGVVTTVALVLILLLGYEPPSWFGTLVRVMDLSLIISSIALGITFFGQGKRLWGFVFLSNLAPMLTALALVALGVQLPPAVLFGADAYWLVLYLVGLTVCVFERPKSALPPAA